MTGWAAIRPVLVVFLLLADAFVVATLAIVHPDGWLPRRRLVDLPPHAWVN
jgi:hypothetical protein